MLIMQFYWILAYTETIAHAGTACAARQNHSFGFDQTRPNIPACPSTITDNKKMSFVYTGRNRIIGIRPDKLNIFCSY